jgi:integrase
MAKTYLRLMAPDSGLRRVILRRRSNSDMGRDRKHLTELEVERLLIGFRHGLRPSVVKASTIYVRRAKGGQEATHSSANRLRPFVFASERRGPFTASGCAKLLARAGEEAEIGFKVHPHMLRHAAATRWAKEGLDTPTLQAYLCHRSIDSTTRYAALAIWGRA